MFRLLLSAVILVALLQLWLLLRNKALSPRRRGVRMALNALLGLVLLAFVWQPVWTGRVAYTHALITGSEVPTSEARRIQDSLQLKQRLKADALNPTEVDTVTLLGQDFSPDFLARLSRHTLRWIPYNVSDRPIDLRWKGVVRVGEQQHLRGNIVATKRHKLAVRFGTHTLDSLWVPPGSHPFTLRFPAPARGRNETVLLLDEAPQDTIRFFGQGNQPLYVRFDLATPDFETKTLANWLGQQGNRVTLRSQLSTGVEASLEINPTLRQERRPTGETAPDLIVTEPALVGSAAVRKALADHRSILLLNVVKPEAEATSINRALGTTWRFRKTSNETVLPAGNGLTALPYQFIDRLNQFNVSPYPVAVQQITGKVALSLFNETFPLKLSGDSVSYGRIWNSVLARLRPAPANSFSVEEPVMAGLKTAVGFNRPLFPDARPAGFTAEPLTTASYSRVYRFPEPGWFPIADSVELYVYPSTTDPHRYLSQWLRAHGQHQTERMRVARTRPERVPDWLWLALLLGALTLLWLEPKF